jgi:hypothetical protein
MPLFCPPHTGSPLPPSKPAHPFVHAAHQTPLAGPSVFHPLNPLAPPPLHPTPPHPTPCRPTPPFSAHSVLLPRSGETGTPALYVPTRNTPSPSPPVSPMGPAGTSGPRLEYPSALGGPVAYTSRSRPSSLRQGVEPPPAVGAAAAAAAARRGVLDASDSEVEADVLRSPPSRLSLVGSAEEGACAFRALKRRRACAHTRLHTTRTSRGGEFRGAASLPVCALPVLPPCTPASVYTLLCSDCSGLGRAIPCLTLRRLPLPICLPPPPAFPGRTLWPLGLLVCACVCGSGCVGAWDLRHAVLLPPPQPHPPPPRRPSHPVLPCCGTGGPLKSWLRQGGASGSGSQRSGPARPLRATGDDGDSTDDDRASVTSRASESSRRSFLSFASLIGAEAGPETGV